MSFKLFFPPSVIYHWPGCLLSLNIYGKKNDMVFATLFHPEPVKTYHLKSDFVCRIFYF